MRRFSPTPPDGPMLFGSVAVKASLEAAVSKGNEVSAEDLQLCVDFEWMVALEDVEKFQNAQKALGAKERGAGKAARTSCTASTMVAGKSKSIASCGSPSKKQKTTHVQAALDVFIVQAPVGKQKP